MNDKKIDSKVELKTISAVASQHIYMEGTIEHKIHVDKYNTDYKEGYVVEGTEPGVKYNIKSETMSAMAPTILAGDEVTQILRQGYKASGTMSAGAGIAVKISKHVDSYECVFYTGEIGESFDTKKVKNKDYVRLDGKHLEALCTFIICNEQVVKAKAEAKKIANSTLELD